LTAPFDVSPPSDCQACPRLAEFRAKNRIAHPDWRNEPVQSWGDADARLAIVGLAPGLRGANRTGRPFTGDFAGDLLYETLLAFGFAEGVYEAHPDDGLKLVDCAIINAVRCVPPQNKPTPQEIATCRSYLASAIVALKDVKAFVALGRIAHDSALRAMELRPAAFPFGHGAVHLLPTGPTLFDSYHCSRYNTNTGVLTPKMFAQVFAAARRLLGPKSSASQAGVALAERRV
jgi:uracil-DNA glycosylase family 4